MRSCNWIATASVAIGAVVSSHAKIEGVGHLRETIATLAPEARTLAEAGLSWKPGEARRAEDLVGSVVRGVNGDDRVLAVPGDGAASLAAGLPDLLLLTATGDVVLWHGSRFPWSAAGGRHADVVDASFVVSKTGKLLMRFAELQDGEGRKSVVGDRSSTTRALVDGDGCCLVVTCEDPFTFRCNPMHPCDTECDVRIGVDGIACICRP